MKVNTFHYCVACSIRGLQEIKVQIVQSGQAAGYEILLEKTIFLDACTCRE